MRAVLPSGPSERRREQILSAALELFLEHGISGATVEQLRDASGASIGSIYHHFGAKEGVVEALSLECLSDYQWGFVDELRRRRTAGSGIRAGVAYHLGWTEDRPDRASFLMAMRDARRAGARSPAVDARNREFIDEVAGWMAPFIESGEVRELPVDEFRALWVGPAQHFSGQWLAGRTERSPRAVTSILADAAWQALRGRRS